MLQKCYKIGIYKDTKEECCFSCYWEGMIYRIVLEKILIKPCTLPLEKKVITSALSVIDRLFLEKNLVIPSGLTSASCYKVHTDYQTHMTYVSDKVTYDFAIKYCVLFFRRFRGKKHCAIVFSSHWEAHDMAVVKTSRHRGCLATKNEEQD
jgi:hypothetical protein